jgi:Flp pilus assembly protein TadD
MAQDQARALQVAGNLLAVLDKVVSSSTPQTRFAEMEPAVLRLNEPEKSYRMVTLAKAAFDAGINEKAASYARQLLDSALSRNNWNTGNAVYFGNWLLGRLALRQGDTRLAGEYLLKAAATAGSPQLNSFGPNTLY